MTSLLIGPIYLTYEKVKEHREGKKRIRNHARYEDLRREHEGDLDVREEERMRLDQQRMRTGFGMPEMSDDGRVRLAHDWEAQREAQLMQPRRSRASSLRVDHTGHNVASTIDNNNTYRDPYPYNSEEKRGSWHADWRTGGGVRDFEWEHGRESPVPRRSLQATPLRTSHEYGSNDSLGDRSSARQQHAYQRSDVDRSREHLEPYVTEVPQSREEEPKDMSSLFVDEILRERGLGS